MKIKKLKHSFDYRDRCRSVRRSGLDSLRLTLFISERENCVSTLHVCVYTFILLPFVAGFNLQRLVSVAYFIVAYDDAPGHRNLNICICVSLLPFKIIIYGYVYLTEKIIPIYKSYEYLNF